MYRADLGSRELRVLHCLQNVAGNPAALAKAEREAGLHSRAVTAVPSVLGYPADETLSQEQDSHLRQFAARLGLLGRAVRDFDVVHFNFGETILPARRPPHVRRPGPLDTMRDLGERALWLRDLPLLRAAGKVIAVTYQGDDARQGDRLSRFRINPRDFVPEHYYSEVTDARKREAIARFDRYADLIYALNPDLLYVLPDRARFLPYASVDPREWQPRPTSNTRPVILHAPTHRGVKGTELVLDVLERLRADGEDFELVLVEGMTHDQARRLYERADLLIDQVLLGWYGGLAVELMALAKPVVAYVRDEDLWAIPSAMRSELPVLSATPDTLYDVVRNFLRLSPGERAELGMRSRRFMERWHDPRAIAARLRADYQQAWTQRSRRPRRPDSGRP